MAEKHHYVACVDLEGRSVLVVGAGRVAHEKASGLLDCGAVGDRRRTRGRAGGRGAPRRGAAAAGTGAPTSPAATSSSRPPRTRPSTAASSPTPRRARCSATSSTSPSSAPSSSPRCTARIRSPSRSRPEARRRRSRRGFATRSPQVVRPEHAALAVRLRELRPWAKTHLPTYEARRDYFAGLVREELG